MTFKIQKFKTFLQEEVFHNLKLYECQNRKQNDKTSKLKTQASGLNAAKLPEMLPNLANTQPVLYKIISELNTLSLTYNKEKSSGNCELTSLNCKQYYNRKRHRFHHLFLVRLLKSTFANSRCLLLLNLYIVYLKII